MDREPGVPHRPGDAGGLHEEGRTGPMGVRETSGVEVRLGSRASRARERERRARGHPPRDRSRSRGLIAAGVLVLAALVVGGFLLAPGFRKDTPAATAGPSSGAPSAQADAPLPRRGAPVVVGTADGSEYRIEAVTGGTSSDVTLQSSTPGAGAAVAYVEYILSNPSEREVLLDFPGDVFVNRGLIAVQARGRCMPQAGAPENMCTPPIKSAVVRRLKGGAPVSGDGGDKYMPPGAAYLVRATVAVPVSNRLTRADMGLYIWKQLYMADRLAKEVPFPG